jgi:hypothetical protein
MKRLLTVTVAIILAATGLAQATPGLISPFEEKDFSALGVTTPATSQMSSSYLYETEFSGTVTSQAFNRSGGGYLYLYQVQNDGASVLEVFGVAPFFGLDEAGLLTGNEPAGFLSGGVAPAGSTYDVALDKPLISHNYPGYLGMYLDSGEHTSALYALSPYSPTTGEAYVIDGGVVIVDTFVAVPEPATLGLLLIGGLVLLRRRTR